MAIYTGIYIFQTLQAVKSVLTIHLCHCGNQRQYVNNGSGYGPVKLYLQKRAAVGYNLLTPNPKKLIILEILKHWGRCRVKTKIPMEPWGDMSAVTIITTTSN